MNNNNLRKLIFASIILNTISLVLNVSMLVMIPIMMFLGVKSSFTVNNMQIINSLLWTVANGLCILYCLDVLKDTKKEKVG